MTDKAISPLRQRLIDDMAIRRLGPKTQHEYIRRVKGFADFLGRFPAKATAEDVHRYQLRLASIGATVSTVNATASALRFFFKVTLKRSDLADEVVSVREPRRLPVVLSPEEVGRLLAATTNLKQKAALSLTYATGLRASEVISLKLTDIDRDRMVIRVEQGKGKKDRYVILSPNLLELLREWWRVARKKGGASRARRDGCLPASPGCFPATAGSTSVRATFTGSFAWQRHALALPSVSVSIRCGTALPPICWSKRPISGSSRACPRESGGSARTQEARHDGALHTCRD
jgi:site-specific recombinase XerD